MAEQSRRGTPAWYDEPGTAFLPKQTPLSTVERLRGELQAIDREIVNAERIAAIYPISTRKALVRLRAQRHDVLVNLAAWEDAG